MKHTIFGKHPTLPLYISIDGDVCNGQDKHMFKEWQPYSVHVTGPKEKGYCQVQIWINKIRRHLSVHRLVYETFKGKIPSHLQVDHINEIKTDNRVENLQLLTPSENTLKSTLYGEKHASATITLKIAQAIYDEAQKYRDYKGNYMRGYRNIVAEKFNTTSKIVSKIVRGETWAEVKRS